MGTKTQLKVFTIQTSCIFLYFSFMQVTTWIPLRYWSIWGGGNFLDTWQVLRFADCYQEIGLDIYRTDVGECSSYLYGRSLVQALAFFNIGQDMTQLVGYLFLLLFAISISSVFLIGSKSDALILILVLLSPPVQLLAERGNFDIVVIFGLSVATYLTRRKHEAAAVFVIFIITLMKFYTAPLLLLFTIVGKQLRTKLIAAVLLASSAIVIQRDIAITDTAYPLGAYSQFGMKIWGEYLNLFNLTSGSDSRNLAISLIVLLFCCFSIVLFKKWINLIIEFPPIWQKNASQLFFLTFIASYLAGTNFDYRLTILFFAVFGYLQSIEKSKQLPYVIFLIVILWISFPSGGLQPVGDLILELGVATYLVSVWSSRLKFR